MPAPLSPSERSSRARMGALAVLAKYDPQEITAAARAVGPASESYWLDVVDPGHLLDEAERARRATYAKRLHFSKLARKSAAARRRRGGGDVA